MSFFYLSPAKGNLHIHILEIIVLNRIKHLNAILRKNDVEYSEYIIEGSVFDNVGHFMLCTAAILEHNNELYNFIIKTEIALFDLRLRLLSTYNLRCFARKLLKYIRRIDVSLDCLKPLQILCQHLTLHKLSHHLRTDCNPKCSIHYINIKFKFCLNFVAKRKVEIKNGIALIPCGIWKEYLLDLFSMNLKQRLFKTRLNSLQWDPRINELLKKINNTLGFTNISNKNKLRSNEINDKSKYFPPCMLNLHLQLRKCHRLSHDQRFNYSLFLKDIGMPIVEAVKFWKTEYSKIPNGHSCGHNWNKDENKFMYGIRHMYGLEGCKRNYRSRNCEILQGIENLCSEGGCPFKCFSNDKLQELLKLNESDSLMSQIIELKNRKHYTNACLLFLKSNYDYNSVHLNFTPVKYYKYASGN